ncbi:hypothetical protein QPK87_13315 [Kamptonema cortianum]|uniref:Uncharacterized protein n=1 Tax=Geitlerinema calcuttense NRMC-F 0142 TaxID=2922238 RepID=A0ABT7M0T1_9CYAN|nr:hypothetical protein [Geitlerinema calcuttense]MDK3157548.1 hypothetical protein [Kamptonema cortianum]MDL5056960.1 hypothetical protein [Geitlerinema calcuttense NRMC-F 0142]
MLLKNLTTIIICLLLSARTVTAQDFVAELVYCFNSPPPETPDARVSAETLEKIEKTFGYQHARIAQITTSPLDKRKSDFPPLGKDFSLKIEQLEQKDGQYKLRVNFWHKDKSVVETVVDFEKGTPLYIKGPLYDRGLLVLIIRVDDSSPAK